MNSLNRCSIVFFTTGRTISNSLGFKRLIAASLSCKSLTTQKILSQKKLNAKSIIFYSKMSQWVSVLMLFYSTKKVKQNKRYFCCCKSQEKKSNHFFSIVFKEKSLFRTVSKSSNWGGWSECDMHAKAGNLVTKVDAFLSLKYKDLHNCFGLPSLLVEGLLSPRPTPSSCYLFVVMGLP